MDSALRLLIVLAVVAYAWGLAWLVRERSE